MQHLYVILTSILVKTCCDWLAWRPFLARKHLRFSTNVLNCGSITRCVLFPELRSAHKLRIA